MQGSVCLRAGDTGLLCPVLAAGVAAGIVLSWHSPAARALPPALGSAGVLVLHTGVAVPLSGVTE